MQKEVETLTAEKNRLQGQIEPIKEYFRTRDEIKTLGKSKFGGKVVFSSAEATQLKEQLLSGLAIKAECVRLKQENQRLTARCSDMDSSLKKVIHLNQQIAELKNENRHLETHKQSLIDFIRSDPERLGQYQKYADKVNQAHRQHRNRGMHL